MDGDGLVFLGTFADLPEGHAATVSVDGERVAVVRKDGTLWAISNVCPHQNGPLGEGRVRDGYLECPWHGYQFDPCTGLGPPGFTDSVPTYELVHKGKPLRVGYAVRDGKKVRVARAGGKNEVIG